MGSLLLEIGKYLIYITTKLTSAVSILIKKKNSIKIS